MSASNVFPVAVANSAALSLVERYAAIRKTTEVICADLSVEDHMIQSMPDASPAKWHLAHTTWFFETFVLKPNLSGDRLFHQDFTFLFNSYYKLVGAHPNRSYRGLLSRPSLEQVRDYRAYVDRHMVKLLTSDPGSEILTLVEIGLNHEQQHQELIVTDVKHGLWSNPLRPAWKTTDGSFWSDNAERTASTPSWHSFDAGLYSIGHNGDGFSFDNETPAHQVFLNAFEIASRPVTNGEFGDFIRDGGYTRPELWLSDGWDTVKAQGWGAPLYWEQQDGRWQTYTVYGMLAVNPDEPVCHVSYYEADAYAHWAGARLATEAEWEVAGSRQPIEGNFLENGRFHPISGPKSKFFGDVWEWTSSAYSPYPGFRPAPGALGEYNGKFMCSQMVLRGGSCATPRSHIRTTYRNFFPPHARWQFMGIRLAK